MVQSLGAVASCGAKGTMPVGRPKRVEGLLESTAELAG